MPKAFFNWIPCLGAQLWSRGDKKTVTCLSYAADSYSWLSLSLPSWCLNLFRLTQSAKCHNIQVTFSMFYFPLDLDRSPCSVLNLSPPRCRLSIHWTCPPLTWNSSPAQTTKGALDSKTLYVKHQGDMSRYSFVFCLRSIPWIYESKPVPPFLQVTLPMEGQDAGESRRGGQVASGSPHYPHTHPSGGARLVWPLILSCFRGHM